VNPSAHLASLTCLILPLITVGYLLSCWAWPFGHCRRCHGTGRLRALWGRSFRLCPRCDGTGRRLRIGRHLINHIRREYRKGNR
jgi:hypothetical protein